MKRSTNIFLPENEMSYAVPEMGTPVSGDHRFYYIKNLIFFFFSFLWCWGLNPGPCAC
jgi:hypothetical protein